MGIRLQVLILTLGVNFLYVHTGFCDRPMVAHEPEKDAAPITRITDNNSEILKRPPLLDGGFWQVGPGLSQHFSDEKLAQEVKNFTI